MQRKKPGSGKAVNFHTDCSTDTGIWNVLLTQTLLNVWHSFIPMTAHLTTKVKCKSKSLIKMKYCTSTVVIWPKQKQCDQTHHHHICVHTSWTSCAAKQPYQRHNYELTVLGTYVHNDSTESPWPEPQAQICMTEYKIKSVLCLFVQHECQDRRQQNTYHA